jgi:hypothetical protein
MNDGKEMVQLPFLGVFLSSIGWLFGDEYNRGENSVNIQE